MGKIKHNLLFIPFVLLVFFSSFSVLNSQQVKEIYIQNADSAASGYFMENNPNRWLGNVEILINEALLTCDSAHYFPDQRLVDAYGHVHINRGDTLQLWGDFMQYSEIDSIIKVRHNVVLVDKDTRLLTQALNYNMISDVGFYPVKGQIFNGNNELTSRKGAFYTNIDIALFHDSVVIHTPDYTIYSDSLKYNTENKIAYFLDSTHIINEENHIKCERGWYNTHDGIFVINKNAYLENNGRILEGDSVFYDENTEFGIARSNVTIRDTTRNVLLKGNYAEYYKEPEKAMVTDSAVMVQILDGDSLFLHADTLRLRVDTSGNKGMIAYYHVKYFKSNLQGMCDSVFYSTNDSVIQFHGEPVIWSGENQITANYMEIFMKNGAMDHMNMVGLALLVSQDDTSNYNQVKGKNMIGYFKENELSLIDVRGNGQSVYFLKDEEQYIGVNVSVCSNMQIFVKERKPFVIKNRVKPEATLFPLEQAPKDKLILEHFSWLVEYRPMEKRDIFTWNKKEGP